MFHALLSHLCLFSLPEGDPMHLSIPTTTPMGPASSSGLDSVCILPVSLYQTPGTCFHFEIFFPTHQLKRHLLCSLLQPSLASAQPQHVSLSSNAACMCGQLSPDSILQSSSAVSTAASDLKRPLDSHLLMRSREKRFSLTLYSKGIWETGTSLRTPVLTVFWAQGVSLLWES